MQNEILTKDVMTPDNMEIKVSGRFAEVKQRRKPEDDKQRRKPEDDKQRRKPEDEDKQRRKPEEKQEGITEVEGYITTYGNEDIVGDIISQGALDGFIEQFNAGEVMLRMLFQHNRAEIIGQWTELRSDEFGVYGVGEIFEDVQRGADVAALLRRGVLDSFSIGFVASPDGYEERAGGGRIFNEITLVETSVVDVPANPLAKVTDVKNEDGTIDWTKLEKAMRNQFGLSQREAKNLVEPMKVSEQSTVQKNKSDEFYSNLLTKLNEV